MSDIESIVAVAIQYNGKTYSLPSPNRHHHIIRIIAEENGTGLKGENMQGFITSSGSFVDRFAGLNIALSAKQVIDPSNIRANRLFSEDLW